MKSNLREAGVTGLLGAKAVVAVDVAERGSRRGASIHLRGLEQPAARLSGGTIEDSDAWASLDVVQDAYARGAGVQSPHIADPGSMTLAALKKAMTRGLQSDIDLTVRRDYFPDRCGS